MDTPANTNKSSSTNKKLSLSLDTRIIIILLLAVIASMLMVWKPWQKAIPTNARTIEITGETTLKDTPDEFVFNPSYTFENTDKTAALADLTQKSKDIVAELKKQGVSDKQIKTSSNGYNYSYYYDEDSKKSTYTLNLTITVGTYELAQKVQDYLVNTTPQGAVSPQARFSESKRKKLEANARNDATKDARAKVDQTAKNLGFKVGKVKSVKDGGGFGYYPYSGCDGGVCAGADLATSSLEVQPGQNDLEYSINVVYYIH